MGVSLVPALDTHINLQGDLVACPIADDFAAREVGIVTRAGDHRPRLVHCSRSSSARHSNI